MKSLKSFAFFLTPPAMEIFCCIFGGRELRGFFFFSSLFFKEQSEGVFVAIGRRYIVDYSAVSREKRKLSKTDGY